MSLVRTWVAHWQSDPTAVVVTATSRSGEEAVLTGAQLADCTAALAAELRESGVTPGSRVLLSGAASVELVLHHIALLRLGAVVVPANTAYTERELAHIVDLARPTLAIVDEPARLRGPRVTTRRIAAGWPTDPGAARQPYLDVADASAPALIAFTSGTTGRPKGAVLSHANLAAGADAVVAAWGWRPDDRLLCALPLFHMHGLGVALHGSLTAGAAIHLLPAFDPSVIAALAADSVPTMFFGVPTMFARLAEADLLPALARLRLIVSGSAPLSVDLFHRILAATGQAPLERYGMTETVMLCSNPLVGPRVPGRVGSPLPGVELRLAPDGGIEVRGPSVFSGYLDDPDASAAAFTDDGWFRTGDLGELDPEGSLRIIGRATELIITGGYNVYPREVEEVLGGQAGVQDVAVVGKPDPVWGEVVVAFVVAVARRGLVAELAAAAEVLAPFKRPREWRFVPALPRNELGKVRRDVLAGWAADSDA